MHTLTARQTEQASGGILWTTPALVAIADSAALGPLAFAFSVGYGAGTLIYARYLSK